MPEPVQHHSEFREACASTPPHAENFWLSGCAEDSRLGASFAGAFERGLRSQLLAVARANFDGCDRNDNGRRGCYGR